ncbi:MAG: hypothetical protein NZ556_01470 [Fimbriimonadales bacterium]|nr:hypothetical protein [Fimbriimonadales bacterium]
MAFTVQDFEDMLRILEANPEWQRRMREAILSRELLELPARFDRLVRIVEELVEAQRRTEQRVEELAEAQRRTDARVDELARIVQELAQISRDAIRRLERLENWQQGETGRREGERYEREIVARAPALFYGGTGGGKGEPHVREQVGRWLTPLFRQGIDIDPQHDPLLADLIWWKGDRVMVVEVGLKLGVNDVRRAKARAETLRQVGVDATPVVIGEEWGTPDTEAVAQQEGVEWYVRGGLSLGFLEFRKLPDGYEAS